jgi:predicted amidohydrolase
MKCDILITGGHVVDPSRSLSAIGDIAIAGDKILAVESAAPIQAALTVNAEGCLVTPGLIDYHTHTFFRGTENSIAPDVSLLPAGVTTAVDGGSAGCGNFAAFFHSIITTSLVRIIAFLNISSAGQTTGKYDECLDPDCFDSDKINTLFRQYKPVLTGLKLRFSKGIVKEFGLTPLTQSLALATATGCPLMIHATDPPCPTEDWVGRLRPGDVFTHVYHGAGDSIIDAGGKVKQAVKEARVSGVVFDAANGRSNFAFTTALAAIEDNFYPDIISSDLTPLNLYRQPAYGLPFLLSKYLALGMTLEQVIAASTSTPAACLGLSEHIGTLAPGACADVAIFKPETTKVTFQDIYGGKILGSRLLVPKMTIRAGSLVYKDITFNLEV